MDSSNPPQNRAAYLVGPKVYPYQVKPAPYTSPKQGEIVVRNGAVAINPADYVKQDVGNLYAGWVKYPCILGGDVAGSFHLPSVVRITSDHF